MIFSKGYLTNSSINHFLSENVKKVGHHFFFAFFSYHIYFCNQVLS